MTETTSALAAAQQETDTPNDQTAETVVKSSDGLRVSLRPVMRPQAEASVQQDIQPVALQQAEIVTRLSTSGGRHWGVNVGQYTSRYLAEKALLKTALAEMSTLDGTLRKVVKRPTGFDANFLGMTEESAQLACRRLTARNISCSTVGPP